MKSNFPDFIKITFIFFLVVFGLEVQAQSHNIKCVNCKLWQRPPDVKGIVNDFCVCEACREKIKKEAEAKAAEDKRRNDILVAKQKAEAAERDRKERERQAAILAEKKKKEESLARARTEIDQARQRAIEINNRHPNLAKIQGSKTIVELTDLDVFVDENFYGVQYRGEILWKKNHLKNQIQISKAGNNFFQIYDKTQSLNKYRIVDMYGAPKILDGEDWVSQINFDPESNTYTVKRRSGKTEVHPDKITSTPSGARSPNIEIKDFYPTKATFYELWGERYKINRKQWEEYRARNPNSGSVIVMTFDLRIAPGTVMITEADFTVINKKTGYFQYTAFD